MFGWLKRVFIAFGFFLLLINGAYGGSNKIAKSIESIGDDHYYRQESIKVLYDKKGDYRSAFNCKSVMMEMKNKHGGIDTICTFQKDVLLIRTTMGPKKRLSSIQVCPTSMESEVDLGLKKVAKEVDEINNRPNGFTGKMYYLGRTDGWLRDFENIYMEGYSGNIPTSCWLLNRR